MTDQVSIVMPAYNAEKFIAEAILSVQAQTYSNWELLIVDDCSTDDTAGIVERFAREDTRIRYYKQPENAGAAKARNKAIEMAQGRYLAFLDSDDLWTPDKLEVQIGYMQRENVSFSCSIYGKIDENGRDLNRIADRPGVRGYWELLKDCPGNSTVIYDTQGLGKIYVSNIRKRNDYVLWLDVIKKAGTLHCMDRVLGYHREREGSISSNKLSLVKYHWTIYRDMEHLSLAKSIYLLAYWCTKGLRRKLLGK